MRSIRVCFAIFAIAVGFRVPKARAGLKEDVSAGDTCDSQWNNMACAINNGQQECHTCGERIQWLMSQGDSEEAAKRTVAGEFPTECGACGESTTSGSPPTPGPPSPPPSDSYPLDTPVFIRSHRNQNLKDSSGRVQLTDNASAWEKWVLSDAGGGKVTIMSHRWQNLQDNGRVGLSWNSQEWEQWTISDAGDGKVIFTSHRGEYLQDNSGQVKMSGNLGSREEWSIVEAAPPTLFPDDAFTLVVIPDVQFMTLAGNGWAASPPRYATPERWYAQGNWIAANKDLLNIKAVVQVGDLVEKGCDDAHWNVFNRGWDSIHDTGLPYSWAPGNHDCDHLYGCVPYGWTCYNRQVPYFFNRVSFPMEFPSPGHYENMLTLFEAEGIEFIIIAVEWNTPAESLAWARQKVEQYSDRWAIFNAHYIPNAPGFLDLAKSHPKTFMVTQGHACIRGEEWHTFHRGAGAQRFIEVLVDYQCNQNGFLKHFKIDKAAGQVTAYTFNPYTQESRRGAKYEYTWDFQF